MGKKCIISEIYKTSEVLGNPNANPPISLIQATAATVAIFQTKNVKLYVPLVTLPINDNIKFLENIKQGFKRTISWMKYRSEITTPQKKFKLSD